MILWAGVAGALIGLCLLDWSGFGLIFGGLVGATMGRWLRSIMRAEIAKALTDNDKAPLEQETAPRRSASIAPETPRSEAFGEISPSPAVSSRETLEDGKSAVQVLRVGTPGVASAPAVPGLPAEPSAVDIWLAKARDWLLGGNTIVRVGIVILFVGLSFLARMAAYAGLFPIEVRLALVGMVGIGLLIFGFYKRLDRPAFGLSLQGAGIAVLYLTVFAAARGFGLIPPPLAFAFMILFAALGCALALLQNARGMAFGGFFGGFAVPLLLGGEANNPTGLFSYFTILNIAILVIAWRRSWRELNLLGFFATFGIATMWGIARYGPQHYLICQLFLIVSIGIYLAAALLYAHNTPGRFGNAADTTLLFGPAIAGFGLQVGLLHDRPFGSAFAALVFGAVYVGIAAITMRQKRSEMRLVNECLLAIGIGFVTLAIPLALDAKWTSSAWALEGAGAFWVGARQARWMPRAFGLLLQLVAALILIGTLHPNISAIPFANSSFVNALLVAAPVLLTAWWMRQALPHSGSRMATIWAGSEFGARRAVFIAGFLLGILALILEVTRQVPSAVAGELAQPLLASYHQLLVAMLVALGAAALADWFGRSKGWSVARWPACASLPTIVVTFFATISVGRHVLFNPDWLGWIVALVTHGLLLRLRDLEPVEGSGRHLAAWNFATHAGGVWLVTAMVADCLKFGIDRAELWHSSWSGVILLVSAVATLAALTRCAGHRAAPLSDTEGLSWPLHPAARAYWWVAALPLAMLTYVGALTAALLAEGVTNPLPYVPLLNPIDLAVAAALLSLIAWRRVVKSAKHVPEGSGPLRGTPALVWGAALAFAAINGVWLRTAHQWMGVGWSPEELGESAIVQTGLAILWTLLAMGLMMIAKRRTQRILWLTGAGLLLVTVIKLLVIDMSNAQGWERIVTFIGVGFLMLVIGYFVPLPPRGAKEELTA